MNTFLISYDLSNPGQRYGDLSKKIKSYTKWAKRMESCWCICTDDSAKVVRDNLESVIDANDSIFVGKLSGEAAWYGITKNVTDWLHKNL